MLNVDHKLLVTQNIHVDVQPPKKRKKPTKPTVSTSVALSVSSALKKSNRRAIISSIPVVQTPGDSIPVSGSASAAMVSLSPTKVLPHFASAINELHRRRQDFLNAEGNMSRQIKAIERRIVKSFNVDHHVFDTQAFNVDVEASSSSTATGQKTNVNQDGFAGDGAPLSVGGDQTMQVLQVPYVSADAIQLIQEITWPLRVSERYLRRHRTKVEREMQKAAKAHPVYQKLVEPINGFGALGFAQIIGEAGDLSNYSNPAKLWKRMGLGLVGNVRQGKRTDAAEALAHGYSPRRRSVMFVIGDSLLKRQNEYKVLYDARKQYEIEKAQAAGLEVRPAKKGDPFDQDAHGFRSMMKIHRRSCRYVEKRLLRDLWRAWRDVG